MYSFFTKILFRQIPIQQTYLYRTNLKKYSFGEYLLQGGDEDNPGKRGCVKRPQQDESDT